MRTKLTLDDWYDYSKVHTLTMHHGYKDSVGIYRDECEVEFKDEITVLPEEVELFDNINTLTLTFKNLDLAASIKSLAKLPFLGRLYLKSCEYTELTPEIKKLRSLVLLDVGNSTTWQDNNLTTLPPEIGSLKQLRTLCLNNNRNFKSFPSEVANLKKLSKIELRGCKSFPENIHLIPNIETLDLYDCNVQPADLIPLITRPNGLKWITVAEGGSSLFLKLKEDYPGFDVFVERPPILREGW